MKALKKMDRTNLKISLSGKFDYIVGYADNRLENDSRHRFVDRVPLLLKQAPVLSAHLSSEIFQLLSCHSIGRLSHGRQTK